MKPTHRTLRPCARLITWKEIEGFVEAQNKESFKGEINAEGCQAFLKVHPEFPQTEYTAKKLQEWLGDLPMIRSNLERAYESLDLGTLTEVEQPEPKPTKEVNIQPVLAAQTAPPTEEEAEALEKLRDVAHLSDAQRKVRDEKLRRAAIASRNTHRKHDRLALVG
jgi:hypothetical protein